MRCPIFQTTVEQCYGIVSSTKFLLVWYWTTKDSGNSLIMFKEVALMYLVMPLAHSRFVGLGYLGLQNSSCWLHHQDLLTRHKSVVAQFLQTNYDNFFAKYNDLLKSSNYVAKRQSIKLLGEILLDRANYTIMTMYVDSADHLKLTMNLLRDKSRNVQYEAFHVFKVWIIRIVIFVLLYNSMPYRSLLQIPRNPKPSRIYSLKIERSYWSSYLNSMLNAEVNVFLHW